MITIRLRSKNNKKNHRFYLAKLQELVELLDCQLVSIEKYSYALCQFYTEYYNYIEEESPESGFLLKLSKGDSFCCLEQFLQETFIVDLI